MYVVNISYVTCMFDSTLIKIDFENMEPNIGYTCFCFCVEIAYHRPFIHFHNL